MRNCLNYAVLYHSILSGNQVVFNNVADLKMGSVNVELGNLDSQKLSYVTLNGNVIEGASLTANGILSVVLPESGTGEIVFDDGGILKFTISK